MKAGWYFKYLHSKSNQFEKLMESTIDSTKLEEYTSLKETYDLLLLKLILQKSYTFYEEYSIEEILDILRDDDMYLDCGELVYPVIVELGKKFAKFEPISAKKYQDVIDYDEATILIKEFLKDQFGKNDASIFESFFIKNRRFVLQDKSDDESYVTIGDNDLFISIPAKNDIEKAAMMVHEAGHVKRLVLYPKLTHEVLNEVESITYELRFILWLIINDIHAEDAKNYLLNTMKLYENGSVLHYLNVYHGLFGSALDNTKSFEKKCLQLDLFKKLNISSYQELADLYGTACGYNFHNHFLSFLTVVKELGNHNYLDHYNKMIKAVGNEELSEIDAVKGITNLGAYKKLRKSLLESK